MRRSRDSGAQFDSFPFLNIMIGMIVVLVLFMLIISSRATDQKRLTSAAPISSETGSQPRGSRGRAGASQDELNEEEYGQLRRELRELESRVAERRKQVDRLLKQRSELDVRLQTLEDATLEALLGDDVGEAGYVVGKQDPTIMIPDSTFQVPKQPRFIEVKADAYVVHHDNITTSHRADELKDEKSPLGRFLAEASARRAKEYLLLLVHPNGAEEFEKLSERINSLSRTARSASQSLEPLNIGWEPFDPAWLLWKDENKLSP